MQAWHDIPDELIINFDQTPLSYVFCSKRTLEFKGAKSVPLLGKGKQITGTVDLYIMDTTYRCPPSDVEFPEGFNVTHTPTDWSNEEKVKEHLEDVIFPYLRSKRSELGLPAEQRAFLIYDLLKAKVTLTVLQVIEENHCVGVPAPPNLTHHYQPLDLIPNGRAKKFLNTKFEEWCARQITKQLKDGKDNQVKVDLTLTAMKPIHAKWVIGLYDYLRNETDSIKKSFSKAGITAAIYEEIEGADPFSDLDCHKNESV